MGSSRLSGLQTSSHCLTAMVVLAGHPSNKSPLAMAKRAQGPLRFCSSTGTWIWNSLRKCAAINVKHLHERSVQDFVSTCWRVCPKKGATLECNGLSSCPYFDGNLFGNTFLTHTTFYTIILLQDNIAARSAFVKSTRTHIPSECTHMSITVRLSLARIGCACLKLAV